ncbi:MAG TPA: YggS family pyridoxal phosphate-dependent enzyme [Alphaproteobacteria bacterium]|nr:YggS family pyridoxal phosphate-dependent enzyme [Alphaproteobacteria bacterium]
MTLLPDQVSKSLDALCIRIARAAREAGRPLGDIHLLAASKGQPPEGLRQALAAGLRLFGENRVQEASARWPDLRTEFPDVRLHLIGPLQTNKVSHALALFDCIQTLDRPELAARLAAEQERTGRRISYFVQVNTGEEPQKHGVFPTDLPAFMTLCRETYGLDVRGLMAIPPVDEPPGPHFALLAQLAHTYALPELSMGMSQDFEKAIALGATYVRVGTALFGARTALHNPIAS